MTGKVDRQTYYRVKNSLTFTERVIIDYYELEWHMRSYVPTVDEVVKYVNNKYEKEKKNHRINHTSLNYYLQRRPVIKALEARGIPFRQHSQEDLTATQIAAAITVMNMMDKRSIDEKLDEMGIKPATYYAWLNDPTFKNFVNDLADRNLSNIRPVAIAEFTKKINQGDWPAIKFWLEATGELIKDSAPQSEQMLRMIIEIIQDEVKDPNVIMNIAQRIKLAAANRTLEVATENVRELPATVTIDDPEVQAAGKKLGVL